MKPIFEYQDTDGDTQCVVTRRIVRLLKVWDDEDSSGAGEVAIFLDDGTHVWSQDSYRTLSARLEFALGTE